MIEPRTGSALKRTICWHSHGIPAAGAITSRREHERTDASFPQPQGCNFILREFSQDGPWIEPLNAWKPVEVADGSHLVRCTNREQSPFQKLFVNPQVNPDNPSPPGRFVRHFQVPDHRQSSKKHAIGYRCLRRQRKTA